MMGAPAQERRSTLADGSTPTSVLLIEDSAFIAHFLEMALRESKHGPFRTRHAECLADGLAMLLEGDVDVVLLDLSLPDSEGLASLEALSVAAPAVPIVVLTGSSDEEMSVQAVQAGAQDYLVKGEVDERWLGRAIRYAIERKRLAEQVRETTEQLRRLAETDALTGVANRAKSTDVLEKLIALALRRREPFSFVGLDLDLFKQVNDQHGHAAGDAVLRRLGEVLQNSFRGEDVVARWGGEEFVIGLYGSTKSDAVVRMTDLLGRWREESFTHADGVTTVSLVSMRPQMRRSTWRRPRAAIRSCPLRLTWGSPVPPPRYALLSGVSI
jgi:diguanylate cyclase (GGDEF)-like protein